LPRLDADVDEVVADDLEESPVGRLAREVSRRARVGACAGERP
jgi:hypothetical protein